MTVDDDLDYIGVSSFGLKMGAILPGTPLKKEIVEVLKTCNDDKLIDDGDILCITEAVVAKSQNNYVELDDIAEEISEKYDISSDSKIGIVFPISSRNRFSAILRGIARSVPKGKVTVQMSFPDDEVGNQIIDADLDIKGSYTYSDLKNKEDVNFEHPITGVNYLGFYEDIILDEAKESEIVLSNDPTRLVGEDLDLIIVSSIHSKDDDKKEIEKELNAIDEFSQLIDLTEICNKGEVSSSWGLLGSNLSTGEKLKLAPKKPFDFVEDLQERVKESIDKDIEILIFGDGAYKDPESGIYELADPVTAFGFTEGLGEKFREGNKYKYLVDKYTEEGYSREEIAEMIKTGEVESEDEGTTPRKVKDLTASLADLVSGSADKGTPLVLIKNFS